LVEGAPLVLSNPSIYTFLTSYNHGRTPTIIPDTSFSVVTLFFGPQEVRDGKMVVVLVGGSNGNHVMAADLGRRPEFEVSGDY
jgi:hypothetical protein